MANDNIVDIIEEDYDVEVEPVLPTTIEEPVVILNHGTLAGRNLANQHTIESVTGLETRLSNIEAVQTVYSDGKNSAEYFLWDESVDVDQYHLGYFVSLCEDVRKVKIYDINDICADTFGVVVDTAGFIGGQTELGLENDSAHALIVRNGIVDVRCEEGINVGDFVVPNEYGYAKRDENHCGYLVSAIKNIELIPYATINFESAANRINKIKQHAIENTKAIARNLEAIEVNKADIVRIEEKFDGEINAINDELTDIHTIIDGLITYGETDLEAGITPLATGKLYFMYKLWISFTVNGVSYTVKDGTKWQAFVDAQEEENALFWVDEENGHICVTIEGKDEPSTVKYNNVDVVVADKIIDGAAYTYSTQVSGGGGTTTCAHTNTRPTTGTPPTCTTNGWSDGWYCYDCQQTFGETPISKLGHSYKTIETGTDPVEGYWSKKQCQRDGCGDIITEYVKTTCDHDYEASGFDYETNQRIYTCNFCGHTYTGDYEQDEDTGGDLECAHNYNSVVTDPTCKKGGYTTYTCTVCQNSYIDDKTDMLGHAWAPTGESRSVGQALYTEYECNRCGSVAEEVTGAGGVVLTPLP